MAYADTYNTANDANFQGMAYVAAWTVAQDIAGTPLANTTPERKAWALRVMSDKMQISARQLAFQMLRDATVRLKGVSATDPEMLNAALSRLDDLVSIG